MSFKANETKFEEKFNSKVEDWPVLGEGGFGRVYKVKNKSAVKLVKTETSEKYLLKKMYKEVEILSKCDEKYVVKYIDSWIENDHLYIEMELCSDNLENIIKRKELCFERDNSQFMSLSEYSLTSQLAKELTECVQYLHVQDPPIIHRDLKPANVLVNHSPNDGRYLKIGDFGLATLGDERTISHTRWVGTNSYLAPEVLDGKNNRAFYSEKADIFSLGKIFSDLFQFNINVKNQAITGNPKLSSFWDKLEEQIDKMTMTRYNFRPDCRSIIEEFIYWGINSIYEIDFNEDLDRMKKFVSSDKSHFFCDYFCEKFEKKTKNSIRDSGTFKSFLGRPNVNKSLEPLIQLIDTIQLIETPEILVFQTKRPKLNLSNSYILFKRVRGKCVIINNFDELGLNNESKRLKNVFEQLHFEIILLSKLNATEIITELEYIRNHSISRDDEAFVLFVVSYGQDKKVYGYNACNKIKKSLREIDENNEDVNNDVIENQAIIKIFSEKNCHQLKNRPKLHFFICCGFKGFPETNSIPSRDGGFNLIANRKEEGYSIDTFSCYACAQGYGAYSNGQWGMTYFTQALTLTIAQYASEDPLNMIMSRTFWRLDEIYHKIPFYERNWNSKSKPIEIQKLMMWREIYFNPGYIEL